MAVFHESDDNQRVDYALLQNGAITLYHDKSILSEDVQWLRTNGYRVHTFDCSAWRDEQGMHRDLADVLGFPLRPFPNLDGLNDFFGDLDVSETGGTAIVFQRFDLFAAAYISVAQSLLDIVADNSRFFLLFGKRLICLVQSDDAQIQFQSVGACPIGWNRKEFLAKNRGS